MKGERGFFLLPVVMLMTIGMGAAFLLIPSFDREDLRERERLLNEQARAAAEGAIETAIHRGADVEGLEVGRATASAKRVIRDGAEVWLAAAEVPFLRDGKVRVEVVRRVGGAPLR